MSILTERLTTFLQRMQSEQQIPGLDCAVWQHGEEVFRLQIGYADLENQIPIDQNTLYNIYSNTKVITCTAALQLYDQGAFLLDDPLERYFPAMANLQVQTENGLEKAKRSITIRDLFRMTAGIGTGNEGPEIGAAFYRDTNGACPLLLLPEYLAKVPLRFSPGEHYLYGICHEMLAALIEKLSGQSFSEYLQTHIFQPLGMENTAFSLDGCRSKALANQYRAAGAGQPPENLGPNNCLIPPVLRESGSGGLISSVEDYMKFQQALSQPGVLLSKGTINLMRADHLEGQQRVDYGCEQSGMSYGLGVRTTVDQVKAGAPIGFGPFGWGGAAGTYGSIDPENEICIFYAQHYFGGDEGRVHTGIRNIVYTSLL